MSRHIPYHTRPLDPIRIPARRLPIGTSIMGMVCVSVAIWWIVIWLAVHIL